MAGVKATGSKRGKPFEPGNRLGRKWKPGESGNPSGVPRNREEAAARIEQRLREEFLEDAVDELISQAKDGSPQLLIEALNRMAGKVGDKLSTQVDIRVLMPTVFKVLEGKYPDALAAVDAALLPAAKSEQ